MSSLGSCYGVLSKLRPKRAAICRLPEQAKPKPALGKAQGKLKTTNQMQRLLDVVFGAKMLRNEKLGNGIAIYKAGSQALCSTRGFCMTFQMRPLVYRRRPT